MSITGTQEFLAQHEGHSISYSLVKTMDHRYSGSIEKYPDGTYNVVEYEHMEVEEVETTGAYVTCNDCKAEEREVNTWEVED